MTTMLIKRAMVGVAMPPPPFTFPPMVRANKNNVDVGLGFVHKHIDIRASGAKLMFRNLLLEESGELNAEYIHRSKPSHKNGKPIVGRYLKVPFEQVRYT